MDIIVLKIIASVLIAALVAVSFLAAGVLSIFSPIREIHIKIMAAGAVVVLVLIWML